MLIKFIVLLIVSLVFISVVVEDVESRVPITFLILQTVGVFVAAYLDGKREDDKRWVYAAGLGYIVLAFVYLVSNYFLQ